MFFYFLYSSVALNYQSDGRMLQINKGRFLANGNCGYVLKPERMVNGKPGYIMKLFMTISYIPAASSKSFCSSLGDTKFDPMSGKDLLGETKKLLKIRVRSNTVIIFLSP